MRRRSGRAGVARSTPLAEVFALSPGIVCTWRRIGVRLLLDSHGFPLFGIRRKQKNLEMGIFSGLLFKGEGSRGREGLPRAYLFTQTPNLERKKEERKKDADLKRCPPFLRREGPTRIRGRDSDGYRRPSPSGSVREDVRRCRVFVSSAASRNRVTAPSTSAHPTPVSRVARSPTGSTTPGPPHFYEVDDTWRSVRVHYIFIHNKLRHVSLCGDVA